MDRIRVFVVHDHAIVRLGILSVLDNESDLLCTGAVADAVEALRLSPNTAPDVLLVQAPRSGAEGAIEALDALLANWPATRALMLVAAPDDTAVPDLGITNRVPLDASPAALIASLRRAASPAPTAARPGGPETGRARPTDGTAPTVGTDLTQRERELLSLMGRGLSNQQISTALNIAMPTVKYHVTNILSKLNADNRTSAVLLALKHRLVFLT